MSDDTFTLPKIHLGGKAGGAEKGQLKVSPHGLGWRSSHSGHKVALESRELKKAKWVQTDETYQLRIEISGGSLYKFGGFRQSEVRKMENFLKKTCKDKVPTESVCAKGWNWGELSLEKDQLEFIVDGKPCFDIPVSDISQCSNTRNDLGIHFNQYDTINAKENDLLSEIHFAVPPTNEKLAALGDDTAAANLKKIITSKSDIDVSTGQGLCMLERLTCIAPRGRYDVELTHRFMKMQGGASQFMIQFSNITRLFCLPRPENRHYDVVITVSPPLRHGLTPYPHIVFHFDATHTIEATMNLSEEDLKDKYEGKLVKHLEGPKHKVVCRLLKALTGITVTVPGTFRNSHDDQSVRCSLKANDGLLYPLERGLVFLHKPATYVSYKEVKEVTFDRAEASDVNTRCFDLTIKTVAGQTHKFQNMQKAEYSKLFSFLSSKNLRISGAGAAPAQTVSLAKGDSSDEEDDEDSSEDEDFNESDGDAEDAPEEYQSDVSSDEEFEEGVGGGGEEEEDDDDDGNDKEEKNVKKRGSEKDGVKKRGAASQGGGVKKRAKLG